MDRSTELIISGSATWNAISRSVFIKRAWKKADKGDRGVDVLVRRRVDLSATLLRFRIEDWQACVSETAERRSVAGGATEAAAGVPTLLRRRVSAIGRRRCGPPSSSVAQHRRASCSVRGQRRVRSHGELAALDRRARAGVAGRFQPVRAQRPCRPVVHRRPGTRAATPPSPPGPIVSASACWTARSVSRPSPTKKCSSSISIRRCRRSMATWATIARRPWHWPAAGPWAGRRGRCRHVLCRA